MKLHNHVSPGATGTTSSRRRVTGLLAGSTTLMLIAGGATAVIAANPPVGPGNVEIFTKRDMVAIEGYTAQAGQDVTIKVTRGGNLIGISHGVVGPDGFFEVNHPGGSCWDVVTPNIAGLDVVTAEFEDGSSDGAVAGTAMITSVESVDGTVTPDIAGDVEGTVVVKGTYGSDVDTNRMGVEIVNPDMRDMGIGERAIGWPDDETPAGYTVDGTAANGEFTVTYGFFSKAEQDTAFAGDPSVASWQAEPATGEEAQLGLTISEFKETDGPGFGGCPAGPAGQAPNAPTEAFASAAGQNGINVTWKPATVPADAPAITGYEVIAVDTVLGQEVSVKVGAEATSATVRGLVNAQAYPVQVVALNGQASTAAGAGTVTVTSSDAPPTASAPSAPGEVAVKDGSLLGSAEVSWAAAAANGSAVTGYTVTATSGTAEPVTTTAGSGATSATLDGLTPGTEYSFVVTANSAAGSTAAESVLFTPKAGDLTAPSAPNVVRVTPGNQSATVEWQPATAGNTPITGYVLTATPPSGSAVEVRTDAAGRSAVLTGLTNNVSYALRLVATSAAGDSAPASFGSGASPTVTPADQLTATAEYRADKREWRIGGSASITTANTITATNANGVRIGTATVAADGSWTIRTRNSNVAVTPTIKISSSAGGSTTVSVSTR
ncbi:fibronectin type III domain-containing protein [Arthrobacter sp.]|uniref:fibronectin type III domain-containing protein n=1 Tax=Arthrobacter sp. TaxID=1667 RepID=UPI002810D6A3|nr:fibronectin type III domain-containing protein [Arthrobacter sp.]